MIAQLLVTLLLLNFISQRKSTILIVEDLDWAFCKKLLQIICKLKIKIVRLNNRVLEFHPTN